MSVEREAVVDAIEAALSTGDPVEAERVCRAWLTASGEDAGLRFLLGDALRDQGRLDEAEGTYRAVVLQEPSMAEAWGALGTTLMLQLRWDEAGRAASRAIREESGHPEGCWVRAVLRERRGDHEGARRDYLRAALAEPVAYPAPVPLDDDTVEEVVSTALMELHPTLRDYLASVPILLDEVPSDEVLREYDPPAFPTEMLGYFSGASLMERSLEDPWSQLPGSIVLFRCNLQRLASDHARLVEELRITILHEVGHFLGLDEHDLEQRGLD